MRADLKRNLTDAKHVADSSTREHLQDTLWPFLEAIVEAIEEIDDSVAELIDHEEDYLQPETAAVFAAVIQSSMLLVAELKKRDIGVATIAATRTDGTTVQVALKDAVEQHEQLCAQAIELLGSVTMMMQEDDKEDDGEAETTEDDNE